MNLNELEVTQGFIESKPYAAARELETLPVESAIALFEALPLSLIKRLINIVFPTYTARVCVQLSKDKAAELIDLCNINHAAAVLRCIPKKNRTGIIKCLPDNKSSYIRVVIKYTDDMVGAWMNPNFVMLPDTSTVENALTRIKQDDTHTSAEMIPVVNLQQALVGVVSITELLKASDATPLSVIIKKAPDTLRSRESLAVAVQCKGWQHYDALPVLNHQRQVIGILSHKELRRSFKQFGDIEDVPQHDNLTYELGVSYLRVFSALLDIITQPFHTRKRQ